MRPLACPFGNLGRPILGFFCWLKASKILHCIYCNTVSPPESRLFVIHQLSSQTPKLSSENPLTLQSTVAHP